jgi:hypothetical protein
VASISEATVSLDEAEAELEKNRLAAVCVARDNQLWQEVEADTKELMKEEFVKKKPLFMPLPPTSCYAAAARIGVESPTLAALAPPKLLSPRYRAHNSPAPRASPELLNARRKVFGALSPTKSSEGSASPQRRLRRFNFRPVLEQQASDLEAANKSFAGYQRMMAEYEKEQPHFFDMQRKFVEKGGHVLPLDEPSRLKLKLARVIGIAPEQPVGVPE